MESKTNNPLKALIFISNESELKEIREKLEKLKNSFDNAPHNLIKRTIIDYLLTINPLSEKCQEKEIIKISNFLIDIYCENKIEELEEKGFYIIEDPLLKFFIKIEDIFPEEKRYMKVCFQIVLLSQNRELLTKYIKYFYNGEINEIEKEINNLNFSNPFSIVFIHIILEVLFNYNKEYDNENPLDLIRCKKKDIQIFRCNKCFDLLYILHSNNGTSLICNDKSHTIIETKSLKTLNNYNLKCCECNQIINIYSNNYKCLKCKKFICGNCCEKHHNNCLLSELIKLYEVGYTCEKHNKKYIDTCDLCNKNLCLICKSYHHHIIKPENHIQLDERKIEKSININKSRGAKNYINYHLNKRYLYMKHFDLKNIKVPKSLHFMINKEDIIFNAKLFFSNKFFDDEFKDYYKYIIDESKQGKIREFEQIKLLEKEYKINNLFSESEEYNNFINLCLINQSRRNEDLNDIYSFVSNILISIQQLFDTQMIFESEKLSNENVINILLLKSIIVKLNKANQIGQLFIKKLLSRYLADYIIKKLIKKYPSKFRKIKFSLNNIYEIITTYGVEIINENDMTLIKKIIKEYLSQENEENRSKYLITIFL